jgi:hypothetical protein
MQFHYEPQDGFLVVLATGPFDAQACRQAMGEIARISGERGRGLRVSRARSAHLHAGLAPYFLGAASSITSAPLGGAKVKLSGETAAFAFRSLKRSIVRPPRLS